MVAGPSTENSRRSFVEAATVALKSRFEGADGKAGIKSTTVLFNTTGGFRKVPYTANKMARFKEDVADPEVKSVRILGAGTFFKDDFEAAPAG